MIRAAVLGLLLTAQLVQMSAPSGVLACSCGPPATVEEVQEMFDQVPLAVIASVEGFETDDPGSQLVMSVERVLNAQDIPDRIHLKQTKENYDYVHATAPGHLESGGPDCFYSVYGDPGERYFLVGDGDSESGYRPSVCTGSSVMTAVLSEDHRTHYRLAIEARALPALGGPPEPSPASDERRRAWLAVGGAVAVLSLAAAGTLVRRRLR